MLPDKYRKIPKLSKADHEGEPLGGLIAICEVCSEPLLIQARDAIFIIESDYLECHYCKQLNPLTDALKQAAAKL